MLSKYKSEINRFVLREFYDKIGVNKYYYISSEFTK